MNFSEHLQNRLRISRIECCQIESLEIIARGDDAAKDGNTQTPQFQDKDGLRLQGLVRLLSRSSHIRWRLVSVLRRFDDTP